MASDFERESFALREAIHGRPVSYSDISANLSYVKGETPSANHKMGSNPAWWLDCQRRGDGATVLKGLDWCEWYANRAPLHENESMTCNSAYRTRIDGGTYALAMFTHFANRPDITTALLKKCRLSVGMCLLQSFIGDARRATNINPQPADIAVLMECTGPYDPLPGNTDGSVPYVANAGMRSWVREGAHHNGAFMGLNDHHLRVLVAQALSLPYRKSYAEIQADHFDTIRARTGLPPWGLSQQDVQDGVSFLSNKVDANLAKRVYQWLIDVPLPKLSYDIIQRTSGAIEVAQFESQNSSTGSKQVEVVMSNGNRYIGSADDGMRGGANSSTHIQPQRATMYEHEWVCEWISGQGQEVQVPRPFTGDAVAWSVNIHDGLPSFNGVPANPNPIPPQPQPPGSSPLIYLGPTAVPGEFLYGSRSASTVVREIHGDAASGYPKRWIAK